MFLFSRKEVVVFTKTLSRLLTAALFLITVSVAAGGPQSNLAPTDDLSAESSLAHTAGIPILVVFSADYCPYCERLKREVLQPLMQQGKLDGKVRLTEINIDDGGKVTDFDGEPVRRRIFVSRYHVFATPTVVLVDFQGNPLTAPIVGFDDPESYSEKLKQLLNWSKVSLLERSESVAGS
jgi:thioredoxin-related protein